jgi:peptidoglycan/xylan/chitin deacetylase (PgdA/CDA1 family)
MHKTPTPFVLAWILFLVFLLGGCAATPPVIISQQPYYRSKEYVIYKMRAGDSAASIAARFLGDPTAGWRIVEANGRLQPGRYVVVPLVQRNPGGVYANGVQQVPILCYHRFEDNCSSPMCMPGATFERQMRYLKDNGYHVIGPEQLLAFLEFRQALPKKSVMITIDDGYRSVYDVAYPILMKYGFPATFFIYTNYVGVSSKAITWDQLKEMKANGITIGSHSMAHSDLSKRGDDESPEAYEQRVRLEVETSKRIIDNKLKQDTFIFAYPFGRVNRAAIVLTRKNGYQLAVTVDRGGNAFFDNPYLLNRDMVLKRDMKTFVKSLKTFQPLSLR